MCVESFSRWLERFAHRPGGLGPRAPTRDRPPVPLPTGDASQAAQRCFVEAARAFEDEAVRHAVFLEVSRQSAPRSVRAALLGDPPNHPFAAPVLDPARTFGSAGVAEEQRWVDEFLRAEGLPARGAMIPYAALERALLDRAATRAQHRVRGEISAAPPGIREDHDGGTHDVSE